MSIQYINNRIYRHLTRPFLRARLRNHDFSIITNSCIGGVIYHELGLPFMSPTINCWMQDKDFYHMVGNLRHYMEQDLVFLSHKDHPEIERTPVALLDDIIIHFNHYDSEEEAATKWYERRARINWNNLFFVASDRPYGEAVSDDEIRSLKHLGGRGNLVFSVRKVEGVDYIFPYPKDNLGDYARGYMMDKTKLTGVFCWEKMFDYVLWLNTGEVRSRKMWKLFHKNTLL